MTDEERVAAIRQKLPEIIKSLNYAREVLRKARREHPAVWLSLEHSIQNTQDLLTLIGPYSKEELATEI
jgi:hypothetical protein